MAYRFTILLVVYFELIEAAEWYELSSAKIAVELSDEFRKGLMKIKNNPYQSQILRSNYRKVNLYKFPYKIVFTIEGNEIIIVAFAHHKRKPGFWENR